MEGWGHDEGSTHSVHCLLHAVAFHLLLMAIPWISELRTMWRYSWLLKFPSEISPVGMLLRWHWDVLNQWKIEDRLVLQVWGSRWFIIDDEWSSFYILSDLPQDDRHAGEPGWLMLLDRGFLSTHSPHSKPQNHLAISRHMVTVVSAATLGLCC